MAPISLCILDPRKEKRGRVIDGKADGRTLERDYEFKRELPWAEAVLRRQKKRRIDLNLLPHFSPPTIGCEKRERDGAFLSLLPGIPQGNRRGRASERASERSCLCLTRAPASSSTSKAVVYGQAFPEHERGGSSRGLKLLLLIVRARLGRSLSLLHHSPHL